MGWERCSLDQLPADIPVFALETGGTPIEDFKFPERGICIIGGLFFAVTAAMLWYFERVASVDAVERTIFFTLFVLMQWWNLFNARMLGSNHSAFRRLWACSGFLLVLAIVLVGQWLIVTFGGQMFRTVPLSWQTWLWMFAVTSPVLWAGELYRMSMKWMKK